MAKRVSKYFVTAIINKCVLAMIWTHKVVFGGSKKRFFDHLCVDEAWTVLPIISRPVGWDFQKDGTHFSHMQCCCLHQIIDVSRQLVLWLLPTISFLLIGTRIQESKSIVYSKCPKKSASVQSDDLSIVYHSLNLSGFSAATSSSSCLRCGCWSPAWTVWKFSPEQDVIFCLICKK